LNLNNFIEASELLWAVGRWGDTETKPGGNYVLHIGAVMEVEKN
jgi:hypothetical protein